MYILQCFIFPVPFDNVKYFGCRAVRERISRPRVGSTKVVCNNNFVLFEFVLLRS